MKEIKLIDIKLELQSVIHLNGDDIKNTPDMIAKFVNMYKSFNLLPSTYYESKQNVMLPEPRIMLMTSEGEWRIMFGFDRIVIIKSPTDLKGENIGGIESFAQQCIDYYSIFVKEFDKRSNRIAIVSKCLLEEMTKEENNKIFYAIFNTHKIHQEFPAYEWDWRMVSLLDKKVNDKDEKINFITELKRYSGKIQILNESTHFDRIQLKLDMNTNQKNQEFRFVDADVVSFFNNCVKWHEDLKDEVIQFVQKATE